jgi:hypothetical protein
LCSLVVDQRQELILQHARVQAMISHCSLDAVGEALSTGVPIVGVPLRGNQPGICVMVQNSGAGRCLLLSTAGKVSVGSLRDVLQEVVVERVDAYRKGARRLQRIIESAGGAARAADVVELALATGLHHLQDPYAKLGLGWFYVSLLDLRFGLLCLALLMYTTVVLTARWLRRIMRRLNRTYNRQVRRQNTNHSPLDNNSNPE